MTSPIEWQSKAYQKQLAPEHRHVAGLAKPCARCAHVQAPF